jgi:hypothetical protein
MIEGLKGASATKPNDLSATARSDQTVESVAIAGATAIQHLITERDGLRGRARVQEDELIGLRAANEDLRRHLTLIRDHYVGLATEVVTELSQIDRLFQVALQRAQDVTNGPEDTSLISLVQRLSPNSERANRATDPH